MKKKRKQKKRACRISLFERSLHGGTEAILTYMYDLDPRILVLFTEEFPQAQRQAHAYSLPLCFRADSYESA